MRQEIHGSTPIQLLCRVGAVAKALDISRSHAYRLVANGTIPSVRVGGSLRIPVAALQLWIEEHTSSTGGLVVPDVADEGDAV
jgi:excisionase family DNA binding protein